MNALTLREAFDEADITKSAEVIPLFAKPEIRETNEQIRVRQYNAQMAMYNAAIAKLSEEERMSIAAAAASRFQPNREYSEEYVAQASRQENHGSIFCSSFAHCIR